MNFRFLGFFVGLIAVPVLVHGGIHAVQSQESDRLGYSPQAGILHEFEQTVKQMPQTLKNEEDLSKEILLHAVSVGHTRPFSMGGLNVID